MFRPSDRQATFGSLAVRLSPEKRAYLDAKYWSGALRRKALPLRLECELLFATRFCSDNGRPNKPVAQVVGLLLQAGGNDGRHEAAPDSAPTTATPGVTKSSL